MWENQNIVRPPSSVRRRVEEKFWKVYKPADICVTCPNTLVEGGHSFWSCIITKFAWVGPHRLWCSRTTSYPRKCAWENKAARESSTIPRYETFNERVYRVLPVTLHTTVSQLSDPHSNGKGCIVCLCGLSFACTGLHGLSSGKSSF